MDKTELIKFTNKYLDTEQRYICVSRPRRFGKSMTLNMLAAYYSRGCNSIELFKGRKIENDKSFHECLNKYDVIYLNMQHFLIESKNKSIIAYLERVLIEEMWEEYNGLFSDQEDTLAAIFRKIYIKSNIKFIFLIDEWDCIMRERQESEELQKEYLDF